MFFGKVRRFFKSRKAFTLETLERMTEEGRQACVLKCAIEGHQWHKHLKICLCCGEEMQNKK